MERYKNFVVYGPGRTGSHWIESLLIGLFGTAHYRNNACCMLDNHWVYHTNYIPDLLEIPRELRDSITLIVCDRSNAFDAIISYAVATKTTEFFSYTDKIVTPFYIESGHVKNLLDSHQFTLTEFTRLIVPLYSSVIRIDYESLSKSEIPEKYLADQLGIDYRVNLEYHHNSIKNIRNYKDVILNWEELHQVYEKWLVDQ